MQTRSIPRPATWSVACTLFSPPSAAAWGTSAPCSYTGASQCQDSRRRRQLPGDAARCRAARRSSGTVDPAAGPDAARRARATSRRSTATRSRCTMTDTSFVGATPRASRQRSRTVRLLDQVGPLAVPRRAAASVPPPPAAGHDAASHALVRRPWPAAGWRQPKSRRVRVTLKPFNQAREPASSRCATPGSQIGRAALLGQDPASAVTVPARASTRPRSGRSKRRTSLSVTLTATAQAGDAGRDYGSPCSSAPLTLASSALMR